MTISEAAKEAFPAGLGIVRASWEFNLDIICDEHGYCACRLGEGGTEPFWSPEAEDLLADDWIVVK